MPHDLKNDHAFNFVRKRAFGRTKITELQRIAVFLGEDTDEGALVMQAADLLNHLRQAIHGGKLEQPSRHWNQ